MKNKDATLVSALVDHLIWVGNKENNKEDIKLKSFLFVIIKAMKNMGKTVNAPRSNEVYKATQLLVPKRLKAILRINGQPMDFE